MSALLPLLLAMALPQAPVAPGPAEQLVATFRGLAEEKRHDAWRHVERRVQREQDPTVVRIFGRQKGLSAYPPLSAPTWHRSEDFAPNAAPPRKPVAEDAESYKATRKQIPRPVFLDDLQTAGVYDWLAGKAARRPQQLDDDALFVNAAHGFLPGTDQTVAQLLELLDDDPHERQLAAYLEHCYADLEAAVYPGITLYDSWYSGQQMDVPDVDAIPFAQVILKTTSFHSPIPANSRRTKLYQQIRDAALEHRKYRTLRQAAAAAFVCAEPVFDPVYRPLVDRFHFAWASVQDDPAGIKALLDKARDRKGLLEDLDKKVASDHEAFELREKHKRELQQVADWLRALCAEALDKVKD